MSLEEIEREYEARRRISRLNRTWKNPRYYTVFPLLPIALVLAILPTSLLWLGRAISWTGEHVDEGLRAMWSPYIRWMEKGTTPPTKATPNAHE